MSDDITTPDHIDGYSDTDEYEVTLRGEDIEHIISLMARDKGDLSQFQKRIKDELLESIEDQTTEGSEKEDKYPSYEIKFRFVESVYVEPEDIETYIEEHGFDDPESAAVEAAVNILHEAPAFDHLGVDEVNDADVFRIRQIDG